MVDLSRILCTQGIQALFWGGSSWPGHFDRESWQDSPGVGERGWQVEGEHTWPTWSRWSTLGSVCGQGTSTAEGLKLPGRHPAEICPSTPNPCLASLAPFLAVFSLCSSQKWTHKGEPQRFSYGFKNKCKCIIFLHFFNGNW